MAIFNILFVVGITMATAIVGLSQVRIVESTCETQLQLIYEQSIQSAIDEISRAFKDFSQDGILQSLAREKTAVSALESCRLYLSLALDNLNNSLVSPREFELDSTVVDDIKIRLSGAGADLKTCIDEFDGEIYKTRNLALEKLNKSIELINNSFDIVEQLNSRISSTDKGTPTSRISFSSSKYRELVETQSGRIYPDLVVAKDGSGNFFKINDALNAVKNYSSTRCVIYVKKGIYNENVKVELSKWNVLMIGDGIYHTVVSSNISSAEGVGTTLTATFAVYGKGFIARDITFKNTAGAINNQAVALFSASDQSVFYKCSIEGYQDSLYAHSLRQFYRECYIYGTIDFIFGNSATVIQHSSILLRRPLPGQENVITSHDKSYPSDNTGISIQNCIIRPVDDLTGVSTFLGRPRSNYALTAFLENQMEILIDPKGWLTLNGPNDGPPPPETVVYVEYNNSGPGAVTSGRVKWKGVKLNLSGVQASRYTVRSLINGDQWLLATGSIAYISPLLKRLDRLLQFDSVHSQEPPISDEEPADACRITLLNLLNHFGDRRHGKFELKRAKHSLTLSINAEA
ncbi:putative pectinesterase/pectinesterase inhibitor 24 [Forsythia ovata]|uniref:Pectinesterase n=1 Tax=Forsythia ovata TaxID=205694 RepID=A0ABD1PYP6_9LAMI